MRGDNGAEGTSAMGSFDDEARADGQVVLDADQAVMLGDDAAGDGQAQARAAVLGREVRQEELVLVFGRNAVTAVGDGDLDRVVVGVEARAQLQLSRRMSLPWPRRRCRSG